MRSWRRSRDELVIRASHAIASPASLEDIERIERFGDQGVPTAPGTYNDDDRPDRGRVAAQPDPANWVSVWQRGLPRDQGDAETDRTPIGLWTPG